MYTGAFLQDPDFIRSLYIVAFALFIIDLRLMNHPRTARRGNVLGAIGMAIAVIAIAFGTINVVGGFLVTDRMLEMFRQRPGRD